jgi:hypothetical protein
MRKTRADTFAALGIRVYQDTPIGLDPPHRACQNADPRHRSHS